MDGAELSFVASEPALEVRRDSSTRPCSISSERLTLVYVPLDGNHWRWHGDLPKSVGRRDFLLLLSGPRQVGLLNPEQ